MIEIKSWSTEKVLLKVEAKTLQGANLQGADLRDADLRVANLQDANLQDANLRDADFRVKCSIFCTVNFSASEKKQAEQFVAALKEVSD